MRMRLAFSETGVEKEISGAVGFSHSLDEPVPQVDIPLVVESVDMARLCARLDAASSSVANVAGLFLDDEIVVGGKQYGSKEVQRVLDLHQREIEAVLVAFPFKCAVPIKTNYHHYPDLSEAMFLFRLGKLCMKTKELGIPMTIEILEETSALKSIFGDENVDPDLFRKGLVKMIEQMRLTKELRLDSLANTLCPMGDYEQQLEAKKRYIRKNKARYERIMKRLVSSIGLSLPNNSLSLNDSRKEIVRLFSTELDLFREKKLLDTLIGYCAFLELQKETKYKDALYAEHLRLSLNPGLGKVAIRPSNKGILLHPHHGVPVVFEHRNSISYQVMYYYDLLHIAKKNKVSRMCDGGGRFIYYNVEE